LAVYAFTALYFCRICAYSSAMLDRYENNKKKKKQ